MAELSADRSAIAADGRDVCVVTVRLKDTKGRFVPDACNGLKLTVEGEASIIGVGNGDPSWHGAENPGKPDCKEFSVRAFNGLAQVLVRSGKTAGTGTLSCSGETIEASSLTLVAL